MLEIKNTIKNAFDGLIPRLDMTKEGISEPDDTSMETSRTEMKREKGMKKMEQNIQELWDNY